MNCSSCRTRSRAETVRVVPGEFRRDDVKVGLHIPVSAGAVPRFLDRFESVYTPLGRSEAILAAAAAHHRLLWIHPFVDGNGRVARLMSHAVLLETLDTGAVWSVARGLARNVGPYKQHLMSCDSARRNDLDGRGALSEEALAEFTAFFLKTCLDQVRFMEELVQPDRLRERIMTWAEEEVRRDALPLKSGQVLEAVLFRGELPRADVAPLLGVTDRHARRIVSALLDRGVLVSEGPRDPLFITFPAALASRWMPGLFPDPPPEPPVPTPTPPSETALRQELARVFELKDTLSDPSHPDAYFQDFEKSLQENSQKLEAFRKIEAVLSVLDAEAWKVLKAAASAHLTRPSPHKGRGWQALFDALSEARGYAYLRSIGCTGIHFVARGDGPTPDIEATTGRPPGAVRSEDDQHFGRRGGTPPACLCGHARGQPHADGAWTRVLVQAQQDAGERRTSARRGRSHTRRATHRVRGAQLRRLGRRLLPGLLPGDRRVSSGPPSRRGGARVLPAEQSVWPHLRNACGNRRHRIDPGPWRRGARHAQFRTREWVLLPITTDHLSPLSAEPETQEPKLNWLCFANIPIAVRITSQNNYVAGRTNSSPPTTLTTR